ncbi:hypothetical protein WJX72_006260 [[Myrmecia] bisecta]|uniref:RRM domain-containing protein n=1 Tax=[Myrmecia] bisecta TaxID=41462 RepID=A0AAW1R7I4_9CHLO
MHQVSCRRGVQPAVVARFAARSWQNEFGKQRVCCNAPHRSRSEWQPAVVSVCSTNSACFEPLTRVDALTSSPELPPFVVLHPPLTVQHSFGNGRKQGGPGGPGPAPGPNSHRDEGSTAVQQPGALCTGAAARLWPGGATEAALESRRGPQYAGDQPVRDRSAGVQSMELQRLQELVDQRDAQIQRLQRTLQHFRRWAHHVQARYQMFNPEAARPARRIYIGNLPPDTTEVELRRHVNDLMVKSGGAAAAGFPVSSCKIYAERAYAFLEFRSVEEASNCMAFDGMAFKESFLKVRRPSNYDVNVAMMLGPTDPDPGLDLSSLEIVKTVVHDSPHKLFIGGLPCDWTEDQVKELLSLHGDLKAFNLVMDKNTGNSKGYAFCEYQDVSRTDAVIMEMNSKQVGNKFLTVKRALAPLLY